ncbi:MAG: NfeD family protein [Bacteroidota bacterium]
MTLTVIIILISLGLILMLLEILVIPGGIVGIIGLGLTIAGVWCAYDLGTATGNYTLLITLLISGMLIYYSLRSNTWNKLMLLTTIKGKVNTFDENLIKEGDTGITISRLAPIGKASINDNFYEVQSVTDFIDENKEIKVVKIEGSKIFVKLKNIPSK